MNRIPWRARIASRFVLSLGRRHAPQFRHQVVEAARREDGDHSGRRAARIAEGVRDAAREKGHRPRGGGEVAIAAAHRDGPLEDDVQFVVVRIDVERHACARGERLLERARRPPRGAAGDPAHQAVAPVAARTAVGDNWLEDALRPFVAARRWGGARRRPRAHRRREQAAGENPQDRPHHGLRKRDRHRAARETEKSESFHTIHGAPPGRAPSTRADPPRFRRLSPFTAQEKSR